MRSALEKLDGTGRKPRGVQVEVLNWLADNWEKHDTFCLQLPTGSGKSFLARAIQLATNAKVITPSNILVDQYIDTYPDANFLKGVDHYPCHQNKALSCAEWREFGSNEEPACKACPYDKCAGRARNGEPTFFNPMSLYYMLLNSGESVSNAQDVVVVDEAHLLLGMINQIGSKRFLKSEYKFNEATITNELDLQVFLADTLRKALKVQGLKKREYKLLLASNRALRKDLKRAQKDVMAAVREVKNLRAVMNGIEENPQNYAVYLKEAWSRGRTDMALYVQPLAPSRALMDKFLGTGKVILMSGTLLEPDRQDLLGKRPYLFLDATSPIPKERRPILNRPVSFKMNKDTPPSDIAGAIREILDLHPGKSTIVHVSYAMAKKLKPLLPEVTLCNLTPEEKISCVEQFKRNGGVFLAAGCAEGLDLKDDFCRVNIIPKLLFPDLGDTVVRKRKTLVGGDRWYDLTTLKWVVQASGRSTRHENDHSITYVLDPMFGRLAKRYAQDLPKSFMEAIKWT